jgi:hypothetical protein
MIFIDQAIAFNENENPLNIEGKKQADIAARKKTRQQVYKNRLPKSTKLVITFPVKP